jgi:hypothetical protein
VETASNLWLASIVPDFGRAPIETLKTFDWRSVSTATLKAFNQTGVRFACGGTDFSVNEEADNPGSKWLQGQFWALLEAERGPWEKVVKALINASGVIRRPLTIRAFDGDNAGLAYVLKTTFARRVGYFDDNALRQDRRGCSNTRLRLLRGESWLSLMVFLDRIGLDARLFMLGAKPTVGRTGVSIRLISAPS